MESRNEMSDEDGVCCYSATVGDWDAPRMAPQLFANKKKSDKTLPFLIVVITWERLWTDHVWADSSRKADQG